jgi:hypothetical protein
MNLKYKRILYSPSIFFLLIIKWSRETFANTILETQMPALKVNQEILLKGAENESPLVFK